MEVLLCSEIVAIVCWRIVKGSHGRYEMETKEMKDVWIKKAFYKTINK